MSCLIVYERRGSNGLFSLGKNLVIYLVNMRWFGNVWEVQGNFFLLILCICVCKYILSRKTRQRSMKYFHSYNKCTKHISICNWIPNITDLIFFFNMNIVHYIEWINLQHFWQYSVFNLEMVYFKEIL